MVARKKIIISVIISIWVGSIIWSTKAMLIFQFTPGKMGKVFNDFPQKSKLVLDQTLPTLILFLHPKCTCSKASVEEIKIIKSSIKKEFKLIAVVQTASLKLTDELEKLKEELSTLPHSTIVNDSYSFETNLFSVKTSGQIYIYSSFGELIYTGGSTSSRGTSSPSELRRTIASILETNKKPHQLITKSIYGCEMDNKNDQR